MTQKVHNVVIVGTGPAGLTAAIYTARASLSPIIYAGLLHGGQLTTTTEVENWPGFEHGIMGPKLMQDMTAQAERFGTEIIYDTIIKVDFSGPIKKLWTDSEEIHAKAVIISTGATAKTMKLENEAVLMGRGLSTCATCDSFFYKNKFQRHSKQTSVPERHCMYRECLDVDRIYCVATKVAKSQLPAVESEVVQLPLRLLQALHNKFRRCFLEGIYGVSFFDCNLKRQASWRKS